ncbi:hypothetical protein Tco_0671639 [Tanacetum coccineum]
MTNVVPNSSNESPISQRRDIVDDGSVGRIEQLAGTTCEFHNVTAGEAAVEEAALYLSPQHNLELAVLTSKTNGSNFRSLQFPTRMLLEESDKVEKYIGGLPDNIQGNLMQADNKRIIDNNLRDNQPQQPPYKRHNVARAYTVESNEKRGYAGTLSLCNKCKLHHNMPYTVKNQGHYKSDCPKLKNKNQRNATGSGEAHERAYALGGREANLI